MANAYELEFFAADDRAKLVLAWIKNDLSAASIVTSAALRALPTQLDLFTAVAGGGGVGESSGERSDCSWARTWLRAASSVGCSA
jgi:hypothetical protein